MLEWGLPGRPAAAALAEARAGAASLWILALGHDDAIKPQALRAGASAFVLIGDPAEHLLAEVRQVRAALRG